MKITRKKRIEKIKKNKKSKKSRKSRERRRVNKSRSIIGGNAGDDEWWRTGGLLNNFHINPMCKIIKSFNGDGNVRGASKYDILFRKQDETKKRKILDLLGILDHEYYLCNRSNIVIFYNRYKLDVLLLKLNEHGINITDEQLLRLPCEYDHTRNEEETLLIAMLYGNIYPCNSSNEENIHPYNIYDDTFNDIQFINLKNAYIDYLRVVDDSLMSAPNISDYTSIIDIKRNKLEIIDKNNIEVARQRKVRSQIKQLREDYEEKKTDDKVDTFVQNKLYQNWYQKK